MSGEVWVLIDRSKDAQGGSDFVELVSAAGFQCTDNRGVLSHSLLNRYDVLVICGQSLTPYTTPELSAIRRFAESGGGLILAADAAAFEFESAQPVARMSQNAVAELFGAAFLSADCPGAKVDGSLKIRLPRRQIRVCVGRFDGVDTRWLIGRECNPILPPPGATILAAQRANGQPVAATFEHGKGRVVMVGGTTFSREHRLACHRLARWAAPVESRSRGAKPAPCFIGAEAKMERGDRFSVLFDAPCRRVARRLPEVLEQLRVRLKAVFGPSDRLPQTCVVTNSVVPGNRWSLDIGGQAPEASRVRHAVLWAINRLAGHHRVLESLGVVFSERAWQVHLMLRLLRELGYEREAERCQERAERWLSEMDTYAKRFDMARTYVWTMQDSPRGLVLLRELEADLGLDVIRKLAQAVPREDPFKHLPGTYAWPSDRTIFFLSLAVGKDLFPWFAARGVTVHPLPIVKPKTRDVRARMVVRLGEAMRDASAALSSRMEAACDLCALGKTREYGSGDWGALCRALVLCRQRDARARRRLHVLFAADKPGALRALAGLALLDLGDRSVAAALIELARSFEPRFQLAVWHALTKAGVGRADELSPERIADSSGRRVAALDVYVGEFIGMHGMVCGYRTNNILSQSGIRHFTRDAAVSVHSVWWVHTSPVWRRRGLARHTMSSTMTHRSAMECSCSSLGTGTRNVAHALYRSYGFTDMGVGHEWSCQLPGAGAGAPAPGVTLRRYRSEDHPRVTAFCRQVRPEAMEPRGPRAAPRPVDFQMTAERDGKLVGFAAAEYWHGKDARMGQLVVGKDDARDAIADALLAALHRAVAEAGAARMGWHDPAEDAYVRETLNRAGYVSKRSGGVWMMQIRDLIQFLRELTPALERRLRESEYKDWRGTIDVLGDKHKARLKISRSAVKAGPVTGRAADIVLAGDDDTITRIALGRETPFGAYLQTRLRLEPRVNEGLTELIETVFAKVLLG